MTRFFLVPLGIITLACALFFFAGALTCRAQQPGPGDFGFRHDLHHDWYKDLKQPGNPYASCCSGTEPGVPGDCRPTKAYKIGDRWRALLDGEWVMVPPDVVLPSSFNKEPYQASICANKYRLIYCFIEKEGGT